MEKLNVEVPEHLAKAIKDLAAKNDRTLTAEVRRALVAYIQSGAQK